MRLAVLLLALPALAASPARAASPVLVELFTSQSCSSCPPADALLARLADASGILALDLHVTYWNGLGWHDPFSLEAATRRQRAYAGLLRLDEIYTPQLVAGGAHQAVGSDSAAVARAIAAARADAASSPTVPLRLGGEGDRLVVEIGAASGDATLWVAGFDDRHVTAIAGGENGGRVLTERHVVRELRPVGQWHGASIRLSAARPAGERVAAFLQASDGRVLASAVLPAGAGPPQG